MFLVIKLSIVILCFAHSGFEARQEQTVSYILDPQTVRSPPEVPPPPYIFTGKPCPGTADNGGLAHSSLIDNLCGDLRKARIPINPVRHGQANYPGFHQYPFELIRKKSLQLFRSTLPILKADKTIPRVAKLADPPKFSKSQFVNEPRASRPVERVRRSVDSFPAERLPVSGGSSGHPENAAASNKNEADSTFCQSSFGRICSLFRVWSRDDTKRDPSSSPPSSSSSSPASPSRRSSAGPEVLVNVAPGRDKNQLHPSTPCPALVDYITPVFAKNYENIWRYVVQIPHEGYFTQTVEVNNCLGSRCQFIDGRCLSSPRWVSLLVAELFYPHTEFGASADDSRVHAGTSSGSADSGFPGSSGFADSGFPGSSSSSVVTAVGSGLSGAAINGSSLAETRKAAGRFQPDLKEDGGGIKPGKGGVALESRSECDGVDEIGCFQVRLYYDWFLIPGGCKCWRPGIFHQYRSSTTST